MTFGVRGLIEGFYDRLWTWEERARVADAIAAAGFDTYVYAPKEDRLQNAGWRTPYPAETEERLVAFGERCRQAGLALWLGLRPVGISYVDDVDAGLVVAKLRRYLELGPARIVLLTDDIPAELDEKAHGRFASLADAHVWLLGRVLDGLPPDAAGRLVFVPTDYHGIGSPYLATVAASLPPSVEVCWTGREVCSPTISAADADRVGSVLGRRPLVWDNYPVNDGPMVGELHIGPIRGRDAALPGSVSGVLVNPALEPEATLIPLLTWADYLRDPRDYDPEASWSRALLAVTGNDVDAAVVGLLAAALDRSVVRQPWEPPPPDVAAAAAHAAGRLRNRALAADLGPHVAALLGWD